MPIIRTDSLSNLGNHFSSIFTAIGDAEGDSTRVSMENYSFGITIEGSNIAAQEAQGLFAGFTSGTATAMTLYYPDSNVGEVQFSGLNFNLRNFTRTGISALLENEDWVVIPRALNANFRAANAYTMGNLTIRGLGGNDTLEGAEGNDLILGGAGNDRLVESQGTDTLRGGAGDDRIMASTASGNNLLDGGTGNDTILSGVGNDRIYGRAGNDVLRDTGYDLNDNDTMWGGAGNDRLIATNGNDVLFGGGGNDRLKAAAGQPSANRMAGGAGNDTLDGGGGNDRLAGGAGQDLFIFRQGFGRDVIRDFDEAEDRLQFNVAVTAEQRANGVVFSTAYGDRLLVLGAEIGQIPLDDQITLL